MGRVQVHLKSKAKSLIGRLIPTDFAEKLTEYSIAARQPSVSLLESSAIPTTGTSWEDVVERGREELWRRALHMIDREDLLVVEFGVWRGYSLRFLAQLNQSPNSRFYGFDSFLGLPEEWRGMEAGHFSTAGEIPDIGDERVQFVKGWFQETLPPLLDKLKAESENRALLVHLDADLYSSTLFVLATLARRFQEFHCIFDEYSGHEIRALYNFLQAFNGTCEMSYHVNWRGDPTTAFGRIRLGAAPR